MKRKRPLRFAERLLGLLAASQNRSDLLGDTEEEFHLRLTEKGLIRADLWYILQILAPLPHFLLVSLHWRVVMFKNYLKITIRNIKRHKIFSFINITGLAVGMTCCILITLFIQDERSYDNYHRDLDRLYRVTMHHKSNWEVDLAYVGPPVGALLKRDFPQVEEAARLRKLYRPLVKYGRKMFYEPRGFWAENEIFKILAFQFKEGDPTAALVRPNTLALSKSTAWKYFGSANPIGKVMQIDDTDYEVTAVYADYPDNTHFKCDLLASFKTIENEDMATAWGWTNFFTYLKLRPNVDTAVFREQILHLEDFYGENDSDSENTYFLQEVKGIHLFSHLAGEAEPPGSPTTIYITATIGFLILLIACINFMNLATARFSTRANEVGIRKVVGARREQLIVQFLGESMLISLLSFIAALALTWICLPLLNEITGKGFIFGDLLRPGIIGIAVLIVVFTGLSAGSYPAFYLSVFRLGGIIKGTVGIGKKSVGLRKVLVLGQFAVSTFLLIGTLVVFQQMEYMKNSSLGFTKEQKLVLPVKNDYLKELDMEPLKTEFLKFPAVKDASVSSHVPGRGAAGWATTLVGREDETGQPMNYWFVDFDFLYQYELKLLAGRGFKKEISGDRDSAYLVNEKVVKAFGLESPEEAIGQRIEVGNGRKGSIIGVVQDFHYAGLQHEIGPLLIAYGPDKGTNQFNPTGLLTLTINPDQMARSLAQLKQKWLEFHPDIPYSYFFIDDLFDMKYRSEARTRKIFCIFACLGLFIACLGLFGLASFVVEQRTKEIGIRKVLGASIPNIVLLLNKEFAKWVVLANVVAWPLAYYFMQKWLQDFYYRIKIGPGPMLLSGAVIVVIALVTVSFKSLRAAAADPASSLRYE